jgi:hypothetical protein
MAKGMSSFNNLFILIIGFILVWWFGLGSLIKHNPALLIFGVIVIIFWMRR